MSQTLPPEVDRENAFLLYATFCGDLVRTSHALNTSTEAVARAAEEGNWNDKLAPILALKKSTRPGDVERAMNRALNFVQAHQMRMFVSRVIQRMTGMSEEDLADYIFQSQTDTNKVSAKLSTRGIADLASAMEKCQCMTYQALNDTPTERVKRKEIADDPDISAGDMHARIAHAMAQVGQDNSPSAQLFDAQLLEAARLKRAIKSKN